SGKGKDTALSNDVHLGNQVFSVDTKGVLDIDVLDSEFAALFRDDYIARTNLFLITQKHALYPGILHLLFQTWVLLKQSAHILRRSHIIGLNKTVHPFSTVLLNPPWFARTVDLNWTWHGNGITVIESDLLVDLVGGKLFREPLLRCHIFGMEHCAM